ncbi:YcfL family protein [Necropsobacter massiliensis]|uniref:YcfL family protein n=1 Tax=Necropsobacter massiliensis TaxID=1400001 RepID=UPI000596074F|nr:DUF1425 domain-containing protein [Necropsobacter massiliensis]
MIKSLSCIALGLLLTACGSTPAPNLVHSTKPILNMESELAALIDAAAEPDSAWIKNKSAQPVTVSYTFFWYDKNGVTQNADDTAASSPSVTLQQKQRTELELLRPTTESVNYRLYLRLK